MIGAIGIIICEIEMNFVMVRTILFPKKQNWKKINAIGQIRGKIDMIMIKL